MATYYRKNYIALQYTDPNDLAALYDFGCPVYNNADNQLTILIGGDYVLLPLNGWVVKAPGDPPDRFTVRSDEDFHQQFSEIVDGVAPPPPPPPPPSTPPSEPPADEPADPDTEPPAGPSEPPAGGDTPPPADPPTDPTTSDTEPPVAPDGQPSEPPSQPPSGEP